MKCENCAYYWKEDGERYPHCQFGEPSWLDIPPCEQEDIDHQREIAEEEERRYHLEQEEPWTEWELMEEWEEKTWYEEEERALGCRWPIII